MTKPNPTRQKGHRTKSSFKPGQSGNPSGKPKAHPELRAKIVAACPEAVDFMISCMRGVVVTVMKDPDTGKMKRVESFPELKERQSAASKLLEWGVPKPAPIQIGAGGDRLDAFMELLRTRPAAKVDDDDDE